MSETAPGIPVPSGKAPEGPTRPTASIEELWQRTNAAGIRFVMTEIDIAESLLARAPGVQDQERRMACLREVRAAIECASRFAQGVEFPNGDGPAIAGRILELKDRVEQLAATWANRRRPGRMG